MKLHLPFLFVIFGSLLADNIKDDTIKKFLDDTHEAVGQQTRAFFTQCNKENWNEFKLEIERLADETNFPFINRGEERNIKTWKAFLHASKNENLDEIGVQATVHNEYARKLNKDANKAGFLALLMLMPVRSVKAIGLIALGTCLGLKKHAMPCFPLYDTDLLATLINERKLEDLKREERKEKEEKSVS